MICVGSFNHHLLNTTSRLRPYATITLGESLVAGCHDYDVQTRILLKLPLPLPH